MTNIHQERVKELLSCVGMKQKQEELIEEMREYFNMGMKFDARHKNIVKYENTMQKSMELIRGLYDEDLVAELLIAPTQFGKTSTIFWTAHNLMTPQGARP